MSESQEKKAVYRQPVLPQDHGKVCQFSDLGGTFWIERILIGYNGVDCPKWESWDPDALIAARFKMARIKID